MARILNELPASVGVTIGAMWPLVFRPTEHLTRGRWAAGCQELATLEASVFPVRWVTRSRGVLEAIGDRRLCVQD